MDLAAMRTAVSDRTRIASTDARYSAIDQLVNDAIQAVAMEHANGWPWMRRDFVVPLVVDTPEFTFDDIATAIGNDPLDVILKIRDVILDISGGVAILERRPVIEMRRQYGGLGSTIPASWDADGNSLWTYPAPNDTYDATLSVVVGEPTLVDNTDEPILPDRFRPVAVNYAVHLMYQVLQDAALSEAAYTTYLRSLSRMRANARQYVGPGYSRSEPR